VQETARVSVCVHRGLVADVMVFWASQVRSHHLNTLADRSQRGGRTQVSPAYTRERRRRKS
jgi:hypothetical protein